MRATVVCDTAMPAENVAKERLFLLDGIFVSYMLLADDVGKPCGRYLRNLVALRVFDYTGSCASLFRRKTLVSGEGA
jgi:hypothetical protein